MFAAICMLMREGEAIMGLKNVPADVAAPLAGLIGKAAAGRVSSCSLTHVDDACAITLLSFAAGESVSGESYPGDTLYHVVEGSLRIVFPDGREIPVRAGEVLAVPAGVTHGVEPEGAVKLLQITLAS